MQTWVLGRDAAAGVPRETQAQASNPLKSAGDWQGQGPAFRKANLTHKFSAQGRLGGAESGAEEQMKGLGKKRKKDGGVDMEGGSPKEHKEASRE